MIQNAILFLWVGVFFTYSSEAKVVQEGYYIKDRSFLAQLRSRPDLVIDHVSAHGFEVYGSKGLGRWLQKFEVIAYSLNWVTKPRRNQYPSPEEVGQELAEIQNAFPNLTHLESIGQSTQGRPLWVMKIAKNPRSDEGRPKFKYIANMHGDEIVGRELMVRLIRDLVQNYGHDEFITTLVDNTQIYIMPSMNPDGAAAGTRGNGQHIDLNRDFPDFTTGDNEDSPEGRAPETQAVMSWQAQHPFALSANFHGGAEVVNYPWDTQPDPYLRESLARAVSLEYAKLTPYIGNSKEFTDGVTNGYAWYEVDGGMQDWSIYWHGDLQMTIELSNEKWPDYSEVPNFYQLNRAALLKFIARVHDVH